MKLMNMFLNARDKKYRIELYQNLHYVMISNQNLHQLLPFHPLHPQC